MPRIRTIKPEFWTDEKIISLPYVARLFFIGLWNFCDDFGALQDKPEQLKLLVLPNENRVDIFQIVDLLIASELIERYLDDEKDISYLVIKNWSSHQKVDHPTKSKLIKPGSKKIAIPNKVRRLVAEKYNCKPGEQAKGNCYFCNKPGIIGWSKKKDGSAGSWVAFTHDISHIISENQGGEMDASNLVLACVNCNRSMGTKNAFEWLFNGKYYSNQFSPEILQFRQQAKEFEKALEDSRGLDPEGKGKERKGKGGEGPPLPDNMESNVEETVLGNMIWFEKICMAQGFSLEAAKTSLRKFHLHLEENDKYPKKRKSLFAGFEKWLMGEKTKAAPTGNQVSSPVDPENKW